MIVTNTNSEEDFKHIHDGSFPLPNLDNPLYISKKVAIEGDKILAAGLVKLTCEGVLVIDESLPLLTKVRAIRALIDNQSNEIQKLKLEDCHFFVKREKMRRFLQGIGFINLEHESPMMIHF